MTKIQLPFTLLSPLDDSHIVRIAEIYGTYGILKIHAVEGGMAMMAEFDATRFTADDVKAALARKGFPLARPAV